MDFKDYIDAVIKDLGLEGLPEEKRNELISDMGEAIMKRALVVMYGRLTKEEREEFDGLDPNNTEAAIQYLRSKIEDFDSLIAETARDVMAKIAS